MADRRTPGPVGAGPARGTSLVEVLVVLLLLFWILQAGWATLARSRSGGGAVAERAEALETIRILTWLIPEELALGREGRDWLVSGTDSLPLRAFRGVGMVDPGASTGSTIEVCFRGVRVPAPEKDSVLILRSDGTWKAHDLVSRAFLPGSCLEGAADRRELWTVVPDPGPSVLARVFEKGTYYLSRGALRYRRGLGGRQPVTPERIMEGRFLSSDLGGLALVRWDVLLADGSEGVSGIPAGPGEEVRLWMGGSW